MKANFIFAAVITFTCFLLSPSVSDAGIYQCKDEDGRTAFSDQPCDNGDTKTIEPHKNILEPYVSGRISGLDHSFPLRHGVALWDKNEQTIKLILTKSPLSETQSELAVIGDWSFLEEHKPQGLAEITLFFKSSKPSYKSLRTMRSSFYGINQSKEENADKAFIRNHGGEDVAGHVNKLNYVEENKTHWISFASQEMSPEIRWNISLTLPIKN